MASLYLLLKFVCSGTQADRSERTKKKGVALPPPGKLGGFRAKHLMTSRVFSWKNVPKILTFIAILTTGIMVWALADPTLFGRQKWGVAFVCGICGIWWFLLYWSGTRKTKAKRSDEPTMRLEPLQPPEQAPEFQDYMQLEQWMEKHPNAIPPAMPPEKGSHHYDAQA